VVQFAKKVQELRGADGDIVKERRLMQENVGRRKTIMNIHNSHYQRKKQAVRTLDIAFKRRLSRLNEDDGTYTIFCMALITTRINRVTVCWWVYGLNPPSEG
jgi:hypothetical protein